MSTEELPDIAGIAHHPDGHPRGAVVLTHGAGGAATPHAALAVYGLGGAGLAGDTF